AQLSQPRPAAAVRRRQHHDRIPHEAPVRSTRRRGTQRRARPRRPRARVDPGHGGGIAGCARLVRGAVVVKAAAFAVPGDLATPTGGYAYDRRMIAELTALSWRIEAVSLGDGFPFPTADTRAAARARLAALPRWHPIVIDGLAFGALPDAGEALRAIHTLVAL